MIGVTLTPEHRSDSRRLSLRTLLALTTFELRRVLTRPTIVVASLAGLAVFLRSAMQAQPVLQELDTLIGAGLFILGAAALLVLSRETSRIHGIEDLVNACPQSERRRLTAHAMSSVAVVVLGAGIAAGCLAVFAFQGNAVGSFSWVELTGIIASIWLGALVGVAIGTTRSSGVIAPVLLLVVTGLELYFNLLQAGIPTGGNLKWLLPYISNQGVPAQAFARPDGLRLACLLIAGVLVLSIVIARAAPSERATQIFAVVVGLAVIISLVPIARYPEHPEHARAIRTAGAHQECEVRGDVQYCATAGFEPWIDFWEKSVSPISQTLRDIHPGVALPTVRQSATESLETSGRTIVAAPPNWPRGAEADAARVRLAASFATTTLGLVPRTSEVGGRFAALRTGPFANLLVVEPCQAIGQARAVIAMWLTASAAGDDLRRSEDLLPPSILVGEGDAEVAREMLRRPRAAIAEDLAPRWRTLVSADTRTVELASHLGLSRVKGDVVEDPPPYPPRCE